MPMTTTIATTLALLMLGAAPAALAQGATGVAVLPAGFGEGQAVLRSAFGAADFTTNFNAVTASGNGFGNARNVLGDSKPSLYTLPNNGIAQGIIVLGMCALWSPHYHPRANEILFVKDGNVNITFAEENPVVINGTSYGGRIMNIPAPALTSVTIPQGLIHYIYNPTCANATVITSFDNRDPGTVSIVQQLWNFADVIVSAATGLEQLSVQLARQTIAQTVVIGIDKVCQAQCSGTASAPAASG